ncbi:hypothetical protein HAPG_00078 [Halorubrum phage GNf2]|nr:hypothetical protein HAPG_00078 [Halorubrum phage GNf2]
MAGIYGRCPRCRDVRELFDNGDAYRCADCCGHSYENYGRPSLPHDRGNRLAYDIDWLYSQL